MCGRITIVTWNELLDVIDSIEAGASIKTTVNLEPDWPAQPPLTRDAFPRSIVPLARTQADSLQIVPDQLIWGYIPQGVKDLVFNTRIETAATMPLWRESFRLRHCIVPVQAFYEPHKTELVPNPKTGKERKQLYRFTEPGKQPLLLAGIWEDDRFSILTTKPNDIMAPIHNRMPIILNTEGAREWLLEGGLPAMAPAANALDVQPLYPTIDSLRIS